MALESITKLNVDFYDNKYIWINAKQYDSSSRWVYVTCYNNGELFNISASKHTAYIRYKKSDGLGVLNSCRINYRGEVLVELTEQMLAADGICYVDLIIVNKGKAIVNIDTGEIVTVDNSEILSTMAFCVNVYEAAFDNSLIESSYEYDALNELLQNANAEYSEVVQLARSYAIGDANDIRENEDKDNAKYYSRLARSYAIGDADGVRDNEDADNAKYYSEQSAFSADVADGIRADTLSYMNTTNEYMNTTESHMNTTRGYMNSTESHMNSAEVSESNAKESEVNSKMSEQNALTSEQNALTSEQNALVSEQNAKTSETNAETYLNDTIISASNALESELNSKASEENAKNSEDNAMLYMNNALESANNSSASATAASESATLASESENSASIYAASAQSSMESASESADAASVSEDNAYNYYLQAEAITNGLNGAFLPMGTVEFARLAELVDGELVATGYLYNISDNFVTDETFKVGAGVEYEAGTNVYRTADGFWDILTGTTVTGVKGINEVVYRKGNVELTADNVGAIPTENIATVDEIKSYLGI